MTGLSAVHFAITWPYALRILIESGADLDSKDNYCRRPIHLAVALGQLEAVRILLQADCAISCHDRGFDSLLQMALLLEDTQYKENIINEIAEALIDRHTRLFTLAVSVLPASYAECRLGTRITTSESRLNERLAPFMVRGLELHGCIVPSALNLDNKSVYRSAAFSPWSQYPIRFPINVADKLWDAGFRDLISTYSDGLTPLLDSWAKMDFEMISWLIQRGVSPYARHDETGSSGLHFLARSLQDKGLQFSPLQVDILTETTNRGLIAQLLTLDNTQIDSCSCLCCPGGCTPYVMFLGKGSYYGVGGDFDMMDYPFKVQRLRLWESLPPEARKMSSQLNAHLRLIAFERLRLRHTCCLLDGRGSNHSWAKYYSYHSHIFTPQDIPEAQQKVLLDKELGIYNNRVKACHCPTLEKPLCIAFHQSCSTPPTVSKED